MATLERPGTWIRGIKSGVVAVHSEHEDPEAQPIDPEAERRESWIRGIRARVLEILQRKTPGTDTTTSGNALRKSISNSNGTATSTFTTQDQYQLQSQWTVELPVWSDRVYCIPQTNIFVARHLEVPIPPESMQLFRQKIEPKLLADIHEAKRHIEASCSQRRDPNDFIHEPVELRMSGRALDGPDGTVKLKPTIWVRTSPANHRAMQKAMKKSCMKWVHNTQFGEVMVEISARLLSFSPREKWVVPTGPGAILDDLEGVTLHLEIEDPPEKPHFPDGVFCRATIMQGSEILSQRLSRIGGFVSINGRSLGLTTAHSMLGTLWDILLADDDTSEAIRSVRESTSLSQPSTLLLDDDSISRGPTSDNYACYSRFCLPPLSASRPTKWVSAQLGDAANFLGLKAISVQGAGSIRPAIVFIKDNLKSDFALIHPGRAWSSPTSSYPTVRAICTMNPTPPGPVSIHLGNHNTLAGTILAQTGGLEILGVHLTTAIVELSQPLAEGFSGSWVTRDNLLCGMIIAGYDGEPLAHIIPASNLLRNIEASVGASLSLCNDRKPYRSTIGDEILEIGVAPPLPVLRSEAQSKTLALGRPQLSDPSATGPRPNSFAETSEKKNLDASTEHGCSPLPSTTEMRETPMLRMPWFPLRVSETQPKIIPALPRETSASQRMTETPQRTSEATPRVSQASPQHRGMDEASLAARGSGLRGFRLATIVLTLCLAKFLVMMDQTVVAVIIPRITISFNSLHDLIWYSSAFYMSSFAFQTSWNHIYSHHSAKIPMVMSWAILGIASVLSASATFSVQFILGRALAGLALPGIQGGCFRIFDMAVPPRRRGVVTGLLALSSGLGCVVGILFGGALSDVPHPGWRWCFYFILTISGSLCPAVFVLFRFFKNNPKPENRAWRTIISRLDPFSSLLLWLFANTFVLTLQLGSGTYSWSAPVFYLLFFPTGGLLLLFLGRSRRRNGTLRSGIACERSMICAIIFAICIGGTLIPMLYWVFLWQQIARGTVAMQSALGALPLILGYFIGSVVVGARRNHMGYCPPWMIFAVFCMALGAGIISMIGLDADIDSDKWIGGQLLLGLGTGIGTQIPSIIAHTILDPRDILVGTGLLQGAYSFGAGAFFAIGQAVFTHSLQSCLPGKDDFKTLFKEVKSSTAPAALVESRALGGHCVKVFTDSMLKVVWVIVAVSIVAVVPATMTEWRKIERRREEGRPETFQVVGGSGSPGGMDTLFQSNPARPSTAFSGVTAR